MDMELKGFLDRRFDSIDKRFDGFEERFDRMDQRFKMIDLRFQDVDRHFVRIEERMDGMDRRFTLMDQRFKLLETDIRRTNILVEELRSRIQTVAEGLQAISLKQDQFLKEVREDFNEMRALIKHSYDNVDGRLKAAEDNVVDLDQRVGILEASNN